MKKVYNLLASALIFLAGATSASARHWAPDVSGAVTSVEAGKTYALQPSFSVDKGDNRFLAGQKFTTTANLTLDNIYTFEATSEQDAKGNPVYLLKRQGLTENQYLAIPSNGQFYTSSTDRAWKIVVLKVKDENRLDKGYTYDWTHEKNGTDTTETLKGINAYIKEAEVDNKELAMNEITFSSTENAVVIVSAEANDKTKPLSPYTYFLNGGEGAGDAAKGTDYERNAWLIYSATEFQPKEGLQAVLTETLGADFTLESLNNFVRGTKIGEYSQEKYDAFVTLWNRAQDILNNGATATNEEIDKIAVDLPKAYIAFKASGRGLEEGYYIITSWRVDHADGNKYDGGALYDGSAENAKDARVLWTWNGGKRLRRDGSVTYDPEAPLDYKSVKFIWKVIKDENNPGYFYFQNYKTGKYIGTTSKQNDPLTMTDSPEASYNIIASTTQPGYFSFYSPKLWKKAEWQFGGVHCAGDYEAVVSWDWQAGGSSFKVRELDKAQLDELAKNIEQPERNDKTKALVQKAEEAIANGYAYKAVNATGQKIETATSGDITTKDGLVTDGSQLASPMADKDEGTGTEHEPAVLLDGNVNTYFHTSWHGDADAWKGSHFLQFSLTAPESEILLKWVKRNHDNTNGGAPQKITIWGAKNASALDKDKANKVDADGNAVLDENGNQVVDFDAWKHGQGWDSIAVSQFTYPYEVVYQNDNGEDVKKANFAGTAYFKVPDAMGAYQYFRMEVTKTVADGSANGNKFFFGSEFRVYKGAYDAQKSLIDAVPQADRTALNNALVTAKAELATEKVTQATLEKLQQAYDKFIENYPDPTRVTDAIAAGKKLEAAAEEGTEVGYYAAGSKATYKAAIETVENKLNTITATKQPTVAEVNALLAELNAASTAFANALKVPAEGIYRIVSQSSELSVAGRSIMATSSSRQNSLKMGGRVKDGENYKDESGFSSRLGAYWRVKKVEGGYTYQNVFTGLYLAPKSEKNTRTMSQRETPYVMGLEFAKTPGCFNLVANKDDVQDQKHIYANAEPGSFNLVLWNDANGRDNSAFKFVEAETDAAKAVKDDGYIIDIIKGVPQIITLPITSEAGDNKFYTVIGQDASNNIQLKEHTGDLIAGQAYVLIPADGNTDTNITLYSKEQNLAALAPTHTPASPVNGLVPVFETTKVTKDNGLFNKEHTLVLLSEQNESAAANTGYFTVMPTTTVTGDKFIPAESKITTIGQILTNGKQKQQGIFTLTGIRVKDTKHLPAGLYIINGKKHVVK